MISFDRALLRLKEQAGTQKDKEIAKLLGLSAAAFSDRKKRDAFPEDKLRALAQQRPDLGINVDYVLEETDDEFAGRIQAINRVRAIVEAMPLPEISRKRLQAILTGDPAQDGPLIADALRGDSGVLAPTRPKADDRAKAPPTREELAVGTRADPAWPMVMELVYDELNARKRRMPNGAEFRKLVDAVLVVLRLEEKGELDREKTRRKIDAFL